MFINKKGQTPKIETQQPVVATTKSVLPKTGEIPKDSFERTQEKKMVDDRRKSEVENLNFKKVRIQYYPEDIERMKSMDIEERIQYKLMLKEQNRYIELDDSSEVATKEDK